MASAPIAPTVRQTAAAVQFGGAPGVDAVQAPATELRIAVLIPCYNEALTIAKVVSDFACALPGAEIYVYDNNSQDGTAQIARAEGAIVRLEARQGKGNVVRSMFRDIDADVYLMVDGDDTYPADKAGDLLAAVVAGEADMCVGDRHTDGSYRSENKRPLHEFGNRFIRGLINRLFGANLHDIMSGYRAFSRRFVKNMPIVSEGFEIETEMTLHALDKRFKLVEVPVTYRDRPMGSESKLNTLRDGGRVLAKVFRIFKDYRPLAFFSAWAALFFAAGIAVGTPVVSEFIVAGRIWRIPSAILAVGLEVLATNALICGLILDTIVRQHRDVYELRMHQER